MSFDDGDHWQSLKLDMPAISVRDIQVKDDSAACARISSPARTAAASGFSTMSRRCGRRRTALRRRARAAYLFKPATAVRMRFGDERSDAVAAGTAGRRESAAGRADRLLPRRRRIAPVKLEILDGGGKRGALVHRARGRSMNPDPARDPVTYNEMCKQTPDCADCGLPLYWPAPSVGALGRTAGMHRWSWDMH